MISSKLKSRVCLFAVAVMPFAAAAQWSTNVVELNGVRIERGVSYLAPDRKERADLYLPTETNTGGLRPAVVIIHGGGWVGGVRNGKREQEIGTNLVLRGYVALSIDYILSNHHQAVWPTNLWDCKTAVRWLRKNAGELHVDPNHIGVIGGSAGGHLSAMVTLTTPADGLDPAKPYGEYSCEVQCGVDFYGIADATKWHNATMLGQTIAEAPGLYLTASPVKYARRDSPPLLIAHGTADKTVNVEQSRMLDGVMTKVGATHELIIVPGAPHSFDLHPRQMDLRPAVLGFFDKYLKPKE